MSTEDQRSVPTVEGLPDVDLSQPGHSWDDEARPAPGCLVTMLEGLTSPNPSPETDPNLNLDLLTGNHSQVTNQHDGLTLLSPFVPGGKRTRTERMCANSSNDSSSVGSVVHSSKKASLAVDRFPPVHEKELLNPPNSLNGVQVPGQFREEIIRDKNDLEWYNKSVSSLYSASSPSPYIVLIESSIRGRNIGKLDPICVIDMLTPIIQGKKLITRNGKNQIKVNCDFWQSANDLVQSRDFATAGYRAFIPDSFLRKKGFTTWFPSDRSVKDIVRVCSASDLENIASIKRIVNDDKTILDKIEFTFNSPTIPRHIQIGEFLIQITPSIQRPRRCFRCQRFCHDANQCRSTYPSCEFYSGKHLSNLCPNGHLRPKCKNCKGEHIASSSDCPVFKFEFGILRHRYNTNCNREEAKLMFFTENPDLANRVTVRTDSPPSSPHIAHGGALGQPLNMVTHPDPQSIQGGLRDPLLEISKAMNEHKIAEKISVVNSLIDLNQSRSAILDSLQESLIPSLQQIQGSSTPLSKKQ